MTTQEITTASFLLKYAKSDLNTAKKHGQVCICGTKKGNVEIRFIHETKLFQAVNFNNSNIEITDQLPANEMIVFIASIYIVEE